MRLLATTALIILVCLAGLLANTQAQGEGVTGLVSLASHNSSCSPPDHVSPSQIHVRDDQVIIDLNNTRWASFADTGSMLPVISVHAHSLEIVPEEPGQIQPCDIISYHSPDGPIVHRVIETGWDKSGWYARTRGDGSPVPDPHLVRFENVTGIVVGILY